MADEVRQRKAGQAEDDVVDISGDGRLTKKILKAGNGEHPPKNATHTMIMHYTGRLTNGSVFDSSVQRGTPFEFVLGSGMVIGGWDKGVATMTKGEKAVLKCSPEYAYGSSGAGGVIPPNATLEFEVELLDWKEGGSGGIGSMVTIIAIVAALYFGCQYLGFVPSQ